MNNPGLGEQRTTGRLAWATDSSATHRLLRQTFGSRFIDHPAPLEPLRRNHSLLQTSTLLLEGHTTYTNLQRTAATEVSSFVH